MLYEGVSAQPTTIPLAEVRESVSGQPMSAAGQTRKSGRATRQSALPSRTDIISRAYQVRKVPLAAVSLIILKNRGRGLLSLSASN
jgi:hypothetical protein